MADDYFVNIADPVTLRKSILETSRDSIRILQDYERLNSVREEKANVIAEYEDAMKEIVTLMNKLKNILPKAPAKKIKLVSKKTKASKPSKAKESAPAKQKSALEELQDQLQDIESQLDTL